MSRRWLLDPAEVEFTAIRAQGAGGQHVNKVSSAAHLRFDIDTSSLGAEDKLRLLSWPDQRINSQGTVVIKAQSHRSLPANQAEALARLQALIDLALQPVIARRATKPSRASQKRRLESKTQRAQTKSRRKPDRGEQAW